MNSADKMRRLFDLAAVQANAAPDDAVFEKVKTAYTSTVERKSAQPEPKIWRVIMKSPFTKLAAAAVVVIAGVIGLSLWRSTGSGIALADVLARIEKVKGLRYKTYCKRTNYNPALDKPYDVEMRFTQWVSQEHGMKKIIERPDPNGAWRKSEELYLLPERTMIQIVPGQKTYSRTEVDDTAVKSYREQYSTDPHTFLKETTEHKYKYTSLGIETIDGNEVEVFQTTDPNYVGREFKNAQVDVKMWVDVKTRLPVRYESLQSFDSDQMGHRFRQHLVDYDFQWDVPLDASEFEPVIPDGYKTLVVKYPPHITEETNIEGLKRLVELLGKYPEKISNIDKTLLRLAEKSKTPAAIRLREETKGLSEDEIEGIKLVDFLMPIRGLARFANALRWDKKDPAYYGRIVTPRDTDKVLMRWKLSDNEYRVIYGDLHAETVTPAKLAELEAALPKEPTEEIAIQGLKLLAELLGQYPDPNMDITDFTVLRSAFEKSETPAARRLQEELKSLTEKEIKNKLEDFLMPIRGAGRFYALLAQDKKSPAYYGKTVTPQDADKVLVRWKVSDSEYRVIFGDLHTETVSREKLAELEKALPK